MQTKATLMGHPLHQMLIPFPIAFLSGAVVCDLIGMLGGGAPWWTFGFWLSLAGVISAVIAAAPGIVDYYGAVPPDSSGRKKAMTHMTVNLTGTAIFLIAWIMRGTAAEAPGWLVVILEAGAFGLIGIGGWLGGELVNIFLIGPEHRYAQGGKWREATIEATPGKPAVVATADELKADQMKLLHVNGQRIVLARGESGYHAFDDACTHQGASLADGILMCDHVACLWHGSQFNIKTGGVKCGPAKKELKTYQVEVSGNEVRLTL